jgi:hypothetical protein
MSLAQPPQVPINMGLAPNFAQGARMVGPILLAFNATNNVQPTPTISDDLIIENADGSINNIQGVYFDNSQNNGSVFFTIGDTLQTLVFPPKSYGYLPILATNSLRYSAFAYGTTNIGQFNCLISFLNVPTQPIIWNCVPASYQSRMLISSAANAGNAVLNVSLLNLQNNKTTYIHGFDVTGTSATAEAAISVTFTNLAVGGGFGGIATNTWVVDVPAAPGPGVNFTRRFDPPARVGTNTTAGGFTFDIALLEVPAMGAGQTAAGAVIYYSID